MHASKILAKLNVFNKALYKLMSIILKIAFNDKLYLWIYQFIFQMGR